MIVDSVLTNAKAYIGGDIVECCFAIEGGKIQKVGKEAHMPNADQKINLHHLLVLPGVIDCHVHLRDEERAYKETFLTGTAAAAAGGVTTVLDMPNNSPVTNNVSALRNRMQIAQRRSLVNVGFYSEFPADAAEMKAIAGAGAFGFKLFMGEQIGGLNIDDDTAVEETLGQAAKLQVPVAVHAEDHLRIKKAVDEYKLNHREDLAAFLKAHDERVELAAVERILQLTQKQEKLQLHFCHVSTQKALNAIAEAKRSGRTIVAEATPHHLLLTKNDYARLGNATLTLPPLRTKENQAALWKGIEDATVDIIGSDHAPHTSEEKDASSVWDIKAGIPGLETTLPLILTAVHKNKLTLNRAIQLLAEKPAEIFQLADRGVLQQGKAADLVAVDFNQRYQLDAGKFKSKAQFSPFNKWDVQGKPMKTFVNGQLVMEEGEIVAKPGSGGVIRREPA